MSISELKHVFIASVEANNRLSDKLNISCRIQKTDLALMNVFVYLHR